MRKQSRRASAFAAIVLANGLPTTLAAQDRLPAATGSSESAAFRPQGLPLGGFRLYPTLRISGSYNDNVTRANDRKRGDGEVTISPQVSAQSNWGRHRLNADAYYRNTRYITRTEQNHDEYGINAAGRLDVMRTTSVSSTASYARLAQQRGTPGDLFITNELIRYSTFDTDGTLTHRINRVGLTAGAGITGYRYDDATVDGRRVDQQFRDRDIKRANGRLDYQLSELTTLFVTGTFNRIEYSRTQPLFDRSSEGFTALGGANFQLSRLLRGTIGIGYISQKFDDRRFAGFNGLNYDVSLSYQPTALTSISLAANRRLTDSALLQVVGVLTHNVRVTVDHELLRSLTLQGYVDYTNFVYRGIDRDDGRYDIGLGARYKMNRLASLVLSGSRITQDFADVNRRGYKSNRATISLIVAH
jgi:hypothetical protein